MRARSRTGPLPGVRAVHGGPATTATRTEDRLVRHSPAVRPRPHRSPGIPSPRSPFVPPLFLRFRLPAAGIPGGRVPAGRSRVPRGRGRTAHTGGLPPRVRACPVPPADRHGTVLAAPYGLTARAGRERGGGMRIGVRLSRAKAQGVLVDRAGEHGARRVLASASVSVETARADSLAVLLRELAAASPCGVASVTWDVSAVLEEALLRAGPRHGALGTAAAPEAGQTGGGAPDHADLGGGAQDAPDGGGGARDRAEIG